MKSKTVKLSAAYFVLCAAFYFSSSATAQTSRQISDNAESLTAPAAVTISGSIQADGENLAGALLRLSNNDTQATVTTTTTDAGGNYSFANVANGGNYTVSVSRDNVIFNPAKLSFTNLQTNTIADFQDAYYLCVPESANLLAWYRGENNPDDAKNGLNGANIGATFVAGKVGQAFDFNGVNSFLQIPQSAGFPYGNQPRTVSLWLRPDSAVPGNEIFFYGNNSTRNGFGLDVNGLTAGSNLQLRLATVADDLILVDTGVPLGQFLHVAAVYDGNLTIALYVNGVLKAAKLLAAPLDTTPSDIFVGRFVGFFNGAVDELQIYTRALTAAEINTQFKADNAGTCLAGAVFPSATGGLDATFGNNGRVSTQIGSGASPALGVAIQPDGKIVVVGYNNNGANPDFAIARYNTDGTLDINFGMGGKVTTPIGSGSDVAYDVAIQPDGKIVAAGNSNNGSNLDFAVVRYNTDGTLDTTFGTNGKVTTPIGPSHDQAYGIAIAPDGKIILGGFTSPGPVNSEDFAVVRYNSNGTLDTTFGFSGIVTTPIGLNIDKAYDVAVQPDGKILLVGEVRVGTTYNSAVVRYNTNGTLDTTFGGSGKILTSVGSFNSARAVAVQPDCKIIVGGYGIMGATSADFALFRYTTTGALDTTFDADGKVTTPIGPTTTNDTLMSVSVQPDGKIIAAGQLNDSSGNYSSGIARYNTNGSLDSTFGAGGKTFTPSIPNQDIFQAAALQPDGKLVAVGRNGSTVENFTFVVLRYGFGNADGGFSVNPNTRLRFSNTTRPGSIIADALTDAQLPAFPTGITAVPNAPAYDIRTSTEFSGGAVISVDVAGVANAAVCANLRLLHFVSGAWSAANNGAPVFNAGTCTVSNSANSFSPFAVASAPFAPTAAEVTIGGRITTAAGSGIRNVRITMTDSRGNTRTAISTAFGYYRFTEVAVGESYVLEARAKRYTFTQPVQVVSIFDENLDIDFTAD